MRRRRRRKTQPRPSRRQRRLPRGRSVDASLSRHEKNAGVKKKGGGIRLIIRNNKIAVVIHLLLCAVSFLVAAIIPEISRSQEGYMRLSIVCTIVFFVMYFLCGRFFLRGTNSALMNLASVGALAVVISLGLLIARFGLLFIIMPFYTILWVLHLLETPEILLSLVMMFIPLLPPFFMWLGMMCKPSASLDEGAN